MLPPPRRRTLYGGSLLLCVQAAAATAPDFINSYISLSLAIIAATSAGSGCAGSVDAASSPLPACPRMAASASKAASSLPGKEMVQVICQRIGMVTISIGGRGADHFQHLLGEPGLPPVRLLDVPTPRRVQSRRHGLPVHPNG